MCLETHVTYSSFSHYSGTPKTPVSGLILISVSVVSFRVIKYVVAREGSIPNGPLAGSVTWTIYTYKPNSLVL